MNMPLQPDLIHNLSSLNNYGTYWRYPSIMENISVTVDIVPLIANPDGTSSKSFNSVKLAVQSWQFAPPGLLSKLYI